jgi:hypothetical protein
MKDKEMKFEDVKTPQTLGWSSYILFEYIDPSEVGADINLAEIDWSVCLLTLKDLVSLQVHTRPSFQDELDLCTGVDELIEMEKKKKEMLYLFP